jgi:hypothetical protein
MAGPCGLQQKTEDRLLQAVEAEHTRLTLLAAQEGKPLTQELLHELRNQAILSAPVHVERTMRLIQQQLRSSLVKEADEK